MKNHGKFPARVVKKLVMHTLKRDANSTTCFVIYQPKPPAKLDLFKKDKHV